MNATITQKQEQETAIQLSSAPVIYPKICMTRFFLQFSLASTLRLSIKRTKMKLRELWDSDESHENLMEHIAIMSVFQRSSYGLLHIFQQLNFHNHK